jgi:hypothetical protein
MRRSRDLTRLLGLGLLGLGLLLAAGLCGCASGSSAYRSTLAEADAKAREREPEQAARLYQEASRATKKPEHAAEALYREASMWKRQGQPERARGCLERLAAQHSTSSRGPRIWLDLGRLREEAGDAEGAREAYRKVLSYGDTGLGPRAADALIALSPGPRSSAYRALATDLHGAPDLDAFLRLRLARAQVDEGNSAGALDTCESLAKDHPLPRGVYTDDALLLAARLRRTLGDPDGALVTITALLAAQEKSAIVGSYERSAFAEGRWLAADIHQLDRTDAKSAVQVLGDLVRLDDVSRRRDDALFRMAWLMSHELGDDAAACREADRIDELEPPSSLSACLGAVCSGRPQAEPSRRCDRAVAMAKGLPPAVP